jgi:bacillithiol disulfide reductase
VKPRSVVLRHEDGRVTEIDNDFVLLCTGTHPDGDFLRRLGLTVTSGHRPIFDAETFESDARRGVYVLGTVGSESNFIEKSRLQAPELVKRIAKEL